MKPLETERLHIRPYTLDDVEDLHRVVFSDPEVCRFYCGKTRTLDEMRDNVIYRIKQMELDGPLGFCTVRRGDDGQLLGLVALQMYLGVWGMVWEEAPDDPYSPLEIELSYAFGQAYQKQGYATEACRAVIEYGFRELKLRRIAYGVSRDNPNSWRLMERLGFRLSPNVCDDDIILGVLDNPYF